MLRLRLGNRDQEVARGQQIIRLCSTVSPTLRLRRDFGESINFALQS
jgi:hypothetical protein